MSFSVIDEMGYGALYEDGTGEFVLDPPGFFKTFLARDMKDTKCFYCGKSFGQVVVIWSGMDNSSIVLHPNCAGDLALHLAKDALLGKQKQKELASHPDQRKQGRG